MSSLKTKRIFHPTVDEASKRLVSDFVGGTTVKASRNVKADVLQPTIASIKLPNTSLSTVLNISDTNGLFVVLSEASLVSVVLLVKLNILWV